MFHKIIGLELPLNDKVHSGLHLLEGRIKSQTAAIATGITAVGVIVFLVAIILKAL